MTASNSSTRGPSDKRPERSTSATASISAWVISGAESPMAFCISRMGAAVGMDGMYEGLLRFTGQPADSGVWRPACGSERLHGADCNENERGGRDGHRMGC